MYRDVQRDEAQIVVDELVDMRTDLASSARRERRSRHAPTAGDPAINSPRRAKWLAEQAAEAERRRSPFPPRSLRSPAPPDTGA